MLIAFVLLLQAGVAKPIPPAPQRPLPDPGVIASEQRVTPAGVQSVSAALAAASSPRAR